MSQPDEVDPSTELTRRAAIRDLVIGAALLGLGLVTGGSTLDGRADGIDYVFDGLALGWIAWALVRLARRPRGAGPIEPR
jgi:hypothetical protein